MSNTNFVKWPLTPSGDRREGHGRLPDIKLQRTMDLPGFPGSGIANDEDVSLSTRFSNVGLSEEGWNRVVVRSCQARQAVFELVKHGFGSVWFCRVMKFPDGGGGK